MTHRGPDAAGAYATGPVVLAHRRLSVIDPSPAGTQPMSNADDTIHVVFNGEIYNYRELRADLEHETFTSDTDTEVLLHLYEREGIDCLRKLRGMFAFAIWDERTDRLFLARDRLGQKPLFYRRTDDALTFGSTIGAILTDIDGTPEPDPDALRKYINYQYVPAPKTGFESIRQLGAGEYLVISSDGIDHDSYWSLSFREQRSAPPDVLADRLRATLREATRLRMRSDVPLGVFLSGGLDSSVVTALMAEVSEAPVNTYSIGFDVDRYDELDYARRVANAFDTDHTEFTVAADTLLDSVSELLDHYQMPFGDSSALPTYHVSRLAAEEITVAVSGDGGDESMAGYDRYRYDDVLTRLRRVPRGGRRGLRSILEAVPPPYRGQRHLRKARKALHFSEYDPVKRYAALVCKAVDGPPIVASGDSSPDDIEEFRTLFARSDARSRLDTLLQVDIEMNLPDRLLVKTDRASMAHSLEVRSPFLDHEYMEFCASVPAEYKLNGGTGKWLLKRAFEDDLPDAVLTRSKRGFGAPMDEWLRTDLREFAVDHLRRLGDRVPYDAAHIRRLRDEHLDGVDSHGSLLWNLIVLEMWYQRYID